jgi:integrase
LSHLYRQRKIIRLPDSKTNEPRTIHLSDAALEVLDGVPRIGPYIIAGALPGEPYKNLTRAWAIAREYAGLNDVRLHDLRHSSGSWIIPAVGGDRPCFLGNRAGVSTSLAE